MIAELKKERATLVAQADRIKREIEAADTLLERAERQNRAKPKSPEKLEKQGKSSSFRALIVDVLRSTTGGGMRTAEVVRELTRRGYKPGGKTELRTLVASELWRADKHHQGVKRVEHGLYQAA